MAAIFDRGGRFSVIVNLSTRWIKYCHSDSSIAIIFFCQFTQDNPSHSYLNLFPGNRTIAVVQGSEDYTTIAESFNEVFQEINDVQEEGFIKVEDVNVPVELYLGGDYKVSCLLCVLNTVLEDDFNIPSFRLM